MFFTKKDTITSMCDGTWKPACELSDPAFAQQLIGPTLAISPLSQDAPITICAPFDAQVTTVFPTHHAIGLTSKIGVEYILHLGLDTVELKGEGFEPFVSTGARVRAGEPLVRMDTQLIFERGYATDVLLIATNGKPYTFVRTFESAERIEVGEALAQCSKQ